jgi:hypothetical protein
MSFRRSNVLVLSSLCVALLSAGVLWLLAPRALRGWSDQGVVGPVELLVYPYLGETSSTSVTVSWVTDAAAASEARFSLNQSYHNVVVADSDVYDGKYWHSAVINGLAANTTYYYKVYADGNDITPWSAITFTTAPQSTADTFTFVALGDSRPDYSLPNQAAHDVAAVMNQNRFDLAIHTGDMVLKGGICSGVDSSWNQYIRAYFDVYRESVGNVPFFPSIGNHEKSNGSCGYQSYKSVFELPNNAPSGHQEEYYSFDWGNAHFVSLDVTQYYGSGSPQYNWLVSDLQSNAKPWTFVFFHYPPYSAGYHGSSLDVRYHLVPVFETFGVDVVFNGHDHDYERSCPILNGACTTPQNGGVVYFVTGGAGAGLHDVGSDWFTAHSVKVHHFLRIAVSYCTLQADAIDRNGTLFDSYVIDHCGGSTFTWNGSTSSDWGTAANWTPNQVPSTSASALIPASGPSAWPQISGSVTSHDLTIESGAELTIANGGSLTVEGKVTNLGRFAQTFASVSAGSTTRFLHILNQAGTAEKYFGVDITPQINGMSGVTVAVRGSRECTANAGEAVRRCFDISADGSDTATVTFHYLESERNGLPANSMMAYHWSGGQPWTAAGIFSILDAVGPDYSVTMSGVSSFSPFVLAPNEPTAVSLRSFVWSAEEDRGIAILIFLLLMGIGTATAIQRGRIAAMSRS